MSKIIGIIGGTFNPIHYGHLLMGEFSRLQQHLDKVIFMPNHIPPHRERSKLSSSEDRYTMTLLATLSNPAFSVSRMELDRTTLSYTYDTILALKTNKTQKCVFICGADTLLEHKWYRFQELLKLLEAILVCPRRAYTFDSVTKKYSALSKKLLKKIRPLEMPLIDISSSFIRKCLAKRESIKYLLPEAVESYIIKNNLYSS